MTYDEVMERLAEYGSEQTKKTFRNHGAREPFFGVKVGDLKKLVKQVRNNQNVVQALYESGNHDAMYLAGLAVKPDLMTKETLQAWVQSAYWYMLAEYTVAQVAAESDYALELALEWIDDEEEMITVAGWSTYANYLSITPDEELDLEEIRALLCRVAETIHDEQNRVRYAMNSFVIATGSYVPELTEEAKRTAVKIGKVEVDVGNTACKVPFAKEYIEKVEAKNRIGNKRKTCIC